MITENGGPGASTQHPLQGGNQLQNGPTETIDASESRNRGNPSTSSAEPHISRSGKPYSIKRKLDTAISRKIVGKNAHATILKGNMGYDQYTVPDTEAVETTFVAFLRHSQTNVYGLSRHSLKFV